MEEDLRELINQRIEKLRKKILDTSGRNPLIQNKIRSRSSYIRIVDEKPQQLFDILSQEKSLFLEPLPPITEDNLPDENTQEFLTAFSSLQISDEVYLSQISKIDFNSDEKAFEKEINADRQLKDRLRIDLDLPARPISGKSSSDLIKHAEIHNIDPSIKLPLPERESEDERYNDDLIQTLLLPDQLVKKANNLLSKQKTYKEERGLDIIFLTLGYLNWREPNSNDNKNNFKSPILIIPIELSKESSRKGTRYLVKKNSAITINPVLRHKLVNEFGIKLEYEFDEDESLDIESIFDLIEKINPKIPQWEVSREAVLGAYPFQGINLYNDLRPDIDFSVFPLLKDLNLGRKPSEVSEINYEENLETGKSEAKAPYLVLDADSSQLSAIIKVASGENVALEGPPGSGKSQTIVNVIANSLNSGKKVLFVAQKMAALEVVYNRLKALGLGRLVLPMIAGKDNSTYFYDVLKERIYWKSPQIKFSDVHECIDQFRLQRKALSEYIDLMTGHVLDTKVTIHQAIGLKLKYKEYDIEDKYREHITVDESAFDHSLDLRKIYELAKKGEILRDKFYQSSQNHSLKVNSFDTINIKEIVSIKDDIETYVKDYDVKKRESNYPNILDRNLSDQLLNEFIHLDDEEKYSDFTIKISQESEEYIKSALDKVEQAIDISENISFKGYGVSAQSKDILQISLVINKICFLVDKLEIHSLKYDDFVETIETLFSQQKKYLEMKDIHQSLSKKHFNLAPESFVNLTEMIDELKNHECIFDYVISNKISKVKIEYEILLDAITSYRNMTGITHEIPPIEKLNEIYEVIAGSGIFPIFNSKLTSAKELLALLSGKQPHEMKKMNKSELLDDVKKLQGISNKITDNQLYQSIKHYEISILDLTLLKDTIDGIYTYLEKTNLHKYNLVDFYTSQTYKLYKFIVNESSEEKYEWNELDKKINEISGLIELYNTSKTEINSSVKFLDQYNCNSESLYVMKDISIKLSESYEEVKTHFSHSGHIAKINHMEHLFSLRNIILFVLKLKSCGEDFASLILDKSYIEFLYLYQRGFHLYKSLNEALPVDADLKTHSEVFQYLHNFVENSSIITDLVDASRIYNEAAEIGLSKIVSHESKKLIKKENILAIISRQLCGNFGPADRLSVIKSTGSSMSEAREKIKELDSLIKSYAPIITSKVSLEAADPPSGTGYGRKSDYSELALIKYQLTLKRQIAPRMLLKRAQESLKELFPCWMMTPDNVAQFLDREPTFDLIIIDEASQMTPENSISGLMRAKQALISGDTNQLPPSDFFKLTQSDDDDDDDESVLEESILEQANNMFYPKHQLRWHYRSRHENLIKFSNHHIYNNKLIIFPSPSGQGDELGVSLVRVDGIYHGGAGQARINPAEAKVIVNHIIEFARNNSHRSLGVVVMNANQKEEIDSMLIKSQEDFPHLLKYINDWESNNEGLEKLFVKSIENVQGDERDVIFIGTVYGKDPQGRFFKKFGPISGAAGKKRLNVLLTRAKEQIITFTSIPMNDFEPLPHQQGATLLKSWIQFCQDGVLNEVISNDADGEPDSPFEEHVIEVIESLGYEAIPQVGVTGYHIDIGVKHRDYPYGYLCGVECDGATYHSSKTARDRDILRQKVLENLGWTIYRIWSTDWFNDTLTQKDKLKEYLELLLNNKLSNVTLIQDDTENLDVTINRPDSEPIKLGDKGRIRYLDGVKAGDELDFWLLSPGNYNTASNPNYKNINVSSPLGAALIDSHANDVVHYEHNNKSISVLIILIE